MKLAIVQHLAAGSVEENTAAAMAYLRQARQQGADLVLFPECFLTGYAFPDVCRSLRPIEELREDPDFAAWVGRALSEDDACFCRFRDCCREQAVGAVITGFSKGSDRPRNTAWIIGRDGQILLKYNKVHTCDFSLERYLESGDRFPVCDFEGVKLGVMICYDREYPESARELMLGGAEVILNPNHCSCMFPRLRELSVRAMENMVYAAMANPPGENAGCSCAYSPFVFSPEGPDNTLFIGSGMEQALYFVDLDIDKLRQYRAEEDLGKFRKPLAYLRSSKKY